MVLKAFVAGCSGPELGPDERAFFSEARPCGFVLFARNCIDPDQVRRLVGDVHEAVGTSEILVLVDQEGGRVQRLKPPYWRAYPPAVTLGRLYAKEPERAVQAARVLAQLMGHELSQLGINVDCTPVLDLPTPGAHDVIGDRAFSSEPDTVIALGRAVCEGLLASGVLPTIKHMPGHGRAYADSHASLPSIDTGADELARTDFRPFRALNDMPIAMTAHVLLTAFDTERPASVSPVIMSQVIRGAIGFDGLVLSDDLSMGALSGGMAERALAVTEAGTDVILHCNGRLPEMTLVADAAPDLAGKPLARFDAAMARIGPSNAPDEAEAESLLAELFATV